MRDKRSPYSLKAFPRLFFKTFMARSLYQSLPFLESLVHAHFDPPAGENALRLLEIFRPAKGRVYVGR